MNNMDLFERYPQLNICAKDIEKALALMVDTYKNGGKILVCGNGGSASDADHIVGELMKGFLKDRKITDLCAETDFLATSGKRETGLLQSGLRMTISLCQPLIREEEDKKEDIC